jgi:hypothetical protein
MVLPSKREVELTAHLLNMEESDAADMRAFYDRERRRELWQSRARWAGQAIKWTLIIVGVGTICYVLALLWLLL